jgi:hypothetical protein
MNDLQDTIVAYLVGPFITDRAIDQDALAPLLQKSFPEMHYSCQSRSEWNRRPRKGNPFKCWNENRF